MVTLSQKFNYLIQYVHEVYFEWKKDVNMPLWGRYHMTPDNGVIKITDF